MTHGLALHGLKAPPPAPPVAVVPAVPPLCPPPEPPAWPPAAPPAGWPPAPPELARPPPPAEPPVPELPPDAGLPPDPGLPPELAPPLPVVPPLDAPPVDVLPPDALPPVACPPLPLSGPLPLDEHASPPTEMPKENRQARILRLTGPPRGGFDLEHRSKKIAHTQRQRGGQSAGAKNGSSRRIVGARIEAGPAAAVTQPCSLSGASAPSPSPRRTRVASSFASAVAKFRDTRPGRRPGRRSSGSSSGPWSWPASRMTTSEGCTRR